MFIKQALSYRLLWAVCLFAFGFLAISVTNVAAEDPATSGEQRLITVYDQGEERTFLTKKTTIGDALRGEGIRIEDTDLVEPRVSTKLAATSYQVNIYRARSVVIHDGTSKIQVLTAEQSPRRIMEIGGLKMYDEDTTKLELSRNPLTDGGAGLQLIVDRATPFMFNLYGKTFEARSQATTVGEMLKDKKVTLGDKDGQSVPNDTPLVAGMSVSVWRDGKQTVTQEVAIPKTIEEVKDADRDMGFREVRTAGADGKRQVTYEIEIRNGQEIARKEIASVTTQEPTKEVVVLGTKVSLPAGSHTDWMAAAGISPADYGYVDYIVGRESGWSPTKYNYAGSGAYGLCQALPASKMSTAGSDYMTNPITQLKWCNGYAVGRYGSWAGAYNFWIKNHWW